MDATASPQGINQAHLLPEPEEQDIEFSETKPVRLSLHLIVKRHLPIGSSDWSQEKIISELNKVKRVRLDRENIGEIDSLELFSTQVTNLYLQSNKICTIQNLECLPNLQVLVLSNNQIKEISGINYLEKLLLLDLSENCLEKVNIECIPKSIIILNLTGNSSLKEADYKPGMIRNLPKLKQLNENEISNQERRDAGVNVDSDEEDEEAESEEEKEEEDEISEDQRTETKPGSELFVPFTSSEADLEVSASSSYKQLPKIESSIQGIAADMLLRSQKRLEDMTLQHKRHLQQITNIKIKSKIKPVSDKVKPT
ncbi:leucine-rich repeat-containing protein 46-like [Elysia marginata]|uniref:Leucine-rich repeat-containing protein 46-like n=1 Tax=Elysia marginata TaxID=1093978 RepID=A0AAV4GGP7_9GAST|nr:leucine-rich repeat-containing protein 46-like [Elysia marginata]